MSFARFLASMISSLLAGTSWHVIGRHKEVKCQTPRKCQLLYQLERQKFSCSSKSHRWKHGVLWGQYFRFPPIVLEQCQCHSWRWHLVDNRRRKRSWKCQRGHHPSQSTLRPYPDGELGYGVATIGAIGGQFQAQQQTAEGGKRRPTSAAHVVLGWCRTETGRRCQQQRKRLG